MQVDITSTIYLCAILMAIILIAIIAQKERLALTDRYLITILVTLSITLLHYVLILNQIVIESTALVYIGAASWLTISPLLYLYTRSLVYRSEQWQWKNLLLFPFSVYMLTQAMLLSLGISFGFHLLFKSANAYSISWILIYLMNSLGFTLATLRLLQQSNWSKKQQAQMQWLPLFFKGFAVVLTILTVWLFWCLQVNYFFQQLEYILLLFYVAFIFSLVVFALRASTYWNILSNSQYGHAKKEERELANLHLRLTNYLEAHPLYLNPKLTLTALSAATQIPENQISQLFTQHLNTNFYNFINAYRLTAFEQQLKEKGTKQYTIMALAASAGFASKTTFYKAFKAHYDMTPTAYIKALNEQLVG